MFHPLPRSTVWVLFLTPCYPFNPTSTTLARLPTSTYETLIVPAPPPTPHITILVHSLITTCLDDCSSLLIGLPRKSLHKLQLFQASAACIIRRPPLHPSHHSCTPTAPLAPGLVPYSIQNPPVNVQGHPQPHPPCLSDILHVLTPSSPTVVAVVAFTGVALLSL